jgi:hypothetical protein
MLIRTKGGRPAGALYQCTSRKLAQSITTNIVAMATAIETLNRALRMEAPSLGQAGAAAQATPWRLRFSAMAGLEKRLERGGGDRVVIGL